MGARVELGDPKARFEYCSDCPHDQSCPIQKFSNAFDSWKPGMSTKRMAENAGLQFKEHITPPLSEDDGPYDVYTCTGNKDGKIIGEVKIFKAPLTLVTDSWSAPE